MLNPKPKTLNPKPVGIGSEAAWSLDVGPSGSASKGLRADKSALGQGGLLSSGCRGNCLLPTTRLAIQLLKPLATTSVVL